MGTRHLIAVQVDGQYKVAQYGQWDGYPSGQGLIALAFLRDMATEQFKNEFANKCRTAKFFTEEEMNKWEKEWEELGSDGFYDKYPQTSRDLGAKILEFISGADSGIVLKDSLPFAAESLHCEYGYVVDLDTNKFEVYKGFNHDPVPADARFGSLGVEPYVSTFSKDTYYPIHIVASFDLDNLPSDAEFLAIADPSEEEDVS